MVEARQTTRRPAAKKKTATKRTPAKKPATKKSKSLIGVDPLAWLNEEELVDAGGAEKQQVVVEAPEQKAEAKAEDPEAESTDHSDDSAAGSGKDETATQTLEPTEGEADMQNDQSSAPMQESTAVEANVKLDAVQNIATVSDLYERFTALLEDQQTIVVDCDEVESIDAASLQLLLAVNVESMNRGVELELRNPSEEFVHTATLLGMQKELLQGAH